MHYLIFGILFSYFSVTLDAKEPLVIGSKRFTESYIIGEILKQVAEEQNEADVIFKQGLGNTGVVFAALQAGLIDLYPEYTGTIASEIFHLQAHRGVELSTLRKKMASLGLGISPPLGFSNSYALAIKKELSDHLGLKKISDLKKFPDLNLGFSQEFMGRIDGWMGLKEYYQLPNQSFLGIDHSLAYEAMQEGQIAVTDVYSTDPKIDKYDLVLLEDDLHFFPVYQAVIVYRLDVAKRFPKIWKAYSGLWEKISNAQIRQLNEKAEFESQPFTQIAEGYLLDKNYQEAFPFQHEGFWDRLLGNDLWSLTKQHLYLVFVSLGFAILVGIPLGIMAFKWSGVRHLVLSVVSIIQTIPSLALLAFLIPLLQQIGTLPALIALSLYALLPIVRNTYGGLSEIPSSTHESAIALGLPAYARLYLVELPLASRSILSGIKTAAVINVGMATMAALIGAGGYGDRIIAGLALNDYEMLLAGAIPACLLALLVQYGFDLFDYAVIPKGLQ